MEDKKENSPQTPQGEEAKEGGKMEEDKNNLTVFDAGEYGKYGEIHYLPGDTEIIMMATMLYMGYTKKLNITPQEFNRIAEVSAMVKAEHIEILLSYPTYSMEYWRLMAEMLGEIVKIVVEEDKEDKEAKE